MVQDHTKFLRNQLRTEQRHKLANLINTIEEGK